MIQKFISLLFISAISLFAQEKVDKLILSGPFATVSHPMLHMVQSGALNDVAKKVEFKQWKNPDELRALILKKEVDFIAIPTNVAANLYNKKQEVQLLNVSIWGILEMLSRDNSIKTLADYKGKEIVVPFRADMPDIVLKQLIKKQGLNLKDYNIKYVASPIDAMQMLILRQADHVLLIEPAASMALRKTKSFPIKLVAPTLYRSVDLQKEWAKVFNTEAKIPQAGVAVIGDMIKNEHIKKRVLEEYGKSLQWYKDNPREAAKMASTKFPMLKEEAIMDSIPNVRLENISAKDSKEDLDFFFDVLLKDTPKSIGSKIPDDKFYYGL